MRRLKHLCPEKRSDARVCITAPTRKNGISYVQRDVVWDNASRIAALKDLITTTQANNQSLGYDALDRLTTTTLGLTTNPVTQTLAYDAIGNRTSATINGIIATYNLPTNSHKLTSTVGGLNPRVFTYDAMGNLTNDGKYTNTYLNNHQRGQALQSSKGSGLASCLIHISMRSFNDGASPSN